MNKSSKRYKQLEATIADKPLNEAVEIIKKNATAKFDETVEVSFYLNIQKKHTIRDVITFPHVFGTSPRVLVFAKGKKADEAKNANADHVGADDLVEKISKGWLDFDVTIATPDMMKIIAKIAKILGTKGLMPNPKAKTVTNDVKESVEAIKSGRREFRANSNGVINFPIGKSSMSLDQITSNFNLFYDIVLKKKPSDLKGEYLNQIHLSSTMGKSVGINKKLIKV